MLKTYIIFTQEHLESRLLSCIEFFPVFRYGVNIFTYFGLYGILGFGRKQNTAKAGVREHDSCCTFCYCKFGIFCKGFILAKFRENKFPREIINHSVVY